MNAAIAQWEALPPWLRWPALYACIALPSAAVGALTIGIGNAMFLAGACCILGSIYLIRLGGSRKTVIGREHDGRPVRERVEDADREREIQRGLGLFLTGLALWVPLVVRALG